jgi:GTP cyclohydrolase I
MVVVKDIQFYTFCAHHMIPFFGIAHIGYVPQGRILGLSKFARVVRYYSTRLNVQEELTRDIGKRLSGALNPLGIAVVMSAEHLCMTMRGIRSPGAQMTTSYMTGVFRDDNNNARQEFLALINGRI